MTTANAIEQHVYTLAVGENAAEFFPNTFLVVDELIPNCHYFNDGIANDPKPDDLRYLAIWDGNSDYNLLTPKLTKYELEEFISKNLEKYKATSNLLSNSDTKNSQEFKMVPFWENAADEWRSHPEIANKPFLVHQAIFDVMNYLSANQYAHQLCVENTGQILVFMPYGKEKKLINIRIDSNEEKYLIKVIAENFNFSAESPTDFFEKMSAAIVNL